MSENHGPHKPGHYWCKYCEQFVVNNAACKRCHDNSVTHRVNVGKYEKKMKKQKQEEIAKNDRIDAELAAIRKKAEEQHQKNDVEKKGDRSLLISHEVDKDEVEKAKELYGEEFFENVILTEKKKVDKTKIYNDFMKSLPTRIQSKYRKTISKFE